MDTVQQSGLLTPDEARTDGKRGIYFMAIGMSVLSLLLLTGFTVVMVMYLRLDDKVRHAPVVTVIPGIPLEDPKHAEFASFVTKHGKQYDDIAEYNKRMGIYLENMKIAETANKKYGRELLGATVYADLTFDEFAEKMKLTQPHPVRNYPPNMPSMFLLDEEVDWVKAGAVTGVKDQGQCGSCWAFSTTGGIEGANFVKNNKLVSLSEQQLMDCSTSYGNGGCNGGDMGLALKYVVDNGGICSEKEYGYKAADGNCKKCENVVTVQSYKSLQPQDSMKFMQTLNLQPISMAVSANIFWQLYFGGVFPAAECDSSVDSLNHGVLAVGYSMGDGYVLVKNSWGTSWGENGYIKLEMPSGNGAGTCGMLLDNVVPTVAPSA